jgi:hypothetical protein
MVVVFIRFLSRSDLAYDMPCPPDHQQAAGGMTGTTASGVRK